MDPKTATELDRLLASGELSGPEADAIFERVYAGVERAERPRMLRNGLWSAASAAAISLCGLLALWHARGSDSAHELHARGSATHGPVLEVLCSQGTLSACPASAKLIFAAERAAGFLSAYAEPLEPGRERVWYFGSAEESPQLEAASTDSVAFGRAVSLTGAHPPGRYLVRAFLSAQPLSHAQMLDESSVPELRASLRRELMVVED